MLGRVDFPDSQSTRERERDAILLPLSGTGVSSFCFPQHAQSVGGGKAGLRILFTLTTINLNVTPQENGVPHTPHGIRRSANVAMAHVILDR